MSVLILNDYFVLFSFSIKISHKTFSSFIFEYKNLTKNHQFANIKDNVTLNKRESQFKLMHPTV